jgi:hypothetical protein
MKAISIFQAAVLLPLISLGTCTGVLAQEAIAQPQKAGPAQIQIFNGPVRTVHYFTKGLPADEQAAYRELEWQENGLAAAAVQARRKIPQAAPAPSYPAVSYSADSYYTSSVSASDWYPYQSYPIYPYQRWRTSYPIHGQHFPVGTHAHHSGSHPSGGHSASPGGHGHR